MGQARIGCQQECVAPSEKPTVPQRVSRSVRSLCPFAQRRTNLIMPSRHFVVHPSNSQDGAKFMCQAKWALLNSAKTTIRNGKIRVALSQMVWVLGGCLAMDHFIASSADNERSPLLSRRVGPCS